MAKASIIPTAVYGAMEMARAWLDYASRAQNMTAEELQAEWTAVADRARSAREGWEASQARRRDREDDGA